MKPLIYCFCRSHRGPCIPPSISWSSFFAQETCKRKAGVKGEAEALRTISSGLRAMKKSPSGFHRLMMYFIPLMVQKSPNDHQLDVQNPAANGINTG